MDVVMSHWHTRAVVHLGDSAHAMSPQLGQGANLALYDAWVLAECVATQPSVPQALEAYTRARRAHLGYYQLVTRGLTPFFQSDHAGLGLLRDVFMPIMNRVPAFNRAMVIGMCGIADGHPWKQLPVTMPA
jgi:2-polyprenyl-6-methoxyphenol hydroxylase-like FAD-dependent oxidoreductase